MQMTSAQVQVALILAIVEALIICKRDVGGSCVILCMCMSKSKHMSTLVKPVILSVLILSNAEPSIGQGTTGIC